MNHHLIGVETEYGLTVLGPDSASPMRALDASALVEMAAARIPSLKCHHHTPGQAVFLANGALFYIDCGCHPEYATPEVGDPWEAVRCLAAGDLLMEQLVTDWSNRCPDTELTIFKSNVDYSGGASSWASHENYSLRVDPSQLPGQLIPHLVSRIIYTGAGGLNPFSPGIEFCLSPRAYHIPSEISSDSTADRGIFHVKDEPLAGQGWHRLHLLCGDSLCSHQATFLRLGTTALVVAMAEAGLHPGDQLRLRAPVAALRTYNEDPSCRATAELADGRRLTAIDIQFHYLALAERHLTHPAMPEWAGEVCAAWLDMLARLEQAPASVATRLDWAMKYALYDEFMRRQGFGADQIQRYNAAMAETAQARLPRCSPPPDAPLMPGALPGPLPEDTPQADHAAIESGAPPSHVAESEHERFQKLRAELCELDIRFGQLGPRSLFRALARQGLVRHELERVTPEDVRRAVSEPPPGGRAKLRGDLIRQLSSEPGRYTCWWSGVADNTGRFLDLSDPFQTAAGEWQQDPVTPQESLETTAAPPLEPRRGGWRSRRRPR